MFFELVIMISVILAPTLLNQGFAAKTTTSTCTKANGDVVQVNLALMAMQINAKNQLQKPDKVKAKAEIKDQSQSF